ncbi:MAG: hypothetical protein COV72_09330 [Candidatus Omnitrophica bacterium CG11_big_fil_rev_8_21_14_0_20_42_13]|uniref:Photosynthesis system II assembly factor Ycf48/Hcf136-like domain-containing protein n=1 Tax=Candidatus Ghiorseimicrobium undicola TaxID=1974746 RepID=A0A2H0LV58_9BACT|nr:MAG: hypothetical protein COV72_09330 [Candidatus Omnitrophica bacterium CG11_big_fil_rev_8_21_14_0_20_42_13]
MRRLIWVISLLLLFSRTALCDFGFRQINKGLADLNITALAVSSVNPNTAYAGSGKAIYRTDGGGRWRNVLTLKGVGRRINFLAFDALEPDIIFAATHDGLLRIKDADSVTWEKLFSGIGEEKYCTYVLAEGKEIFLGTKSGLFYSRDRGTSWQKAKGELGNSYITSIEKSEDALYVSTRRKLFASRDSGDKWEKLFVYSSSATETEGDILENEAEDIIQPENDEGGRISIDRESGKVYWCIEDGIFESSDGGVSFGKLSSIGLSNIIKRSVLIHSGNLYVSTKKGIFVLKKDEKSWKNIFQGLTTYDIRDSVLDGLGRLWLATYKGVFRSSNQNILIHANSAKVNNWRIYFYDEPGIAELRQAAIKYAEVIDPQKIKFLRRGARLKALLPNVDLDYNKTVNYDSGSDSYYIGPQDWSVGFSWDLGDLVWSDQQRLIDSQVRLMVELRDDILTDLTRLYYERRKLQLDLFLSPPQDSNVRLEKELRLEELTASIDALTDGYLSRQLGLQY